jgi:acetate CoA/acetoacetate CoA-transferase alpha subunit
MAMKGVLSIEDAVALIPDGARLMIGGFMAAGSPRRLLTALAQSGKGGFTIIANDTARPGEGVGELIAARAVRKVITSHIGLNPETQRQMIAGEIEVELSPQGSLVERIRAGGSGLGGVLTRTGLGTLAAEGKQTIEIDGETWLVETPLRADFALIHVNQADYVGNCAYQLTSTNFNPVMALAADVVIAEAREILPVGMISPDNVRTPGVLVDHLVRHAA